MKKKQRTWTLDLEGETRTVTISLGYWITILKVAVDGECLVKKYKLHVLGELYRFDHCGHHYSVRIAGWGLFGKPKLFVDGRDADGEPHSAPAPIAPPARKASPERKAPPAGNDHATGDLEIRIIEAERITEPLGEETREIDNLQSGSKIVRRITVSREWRKTLTIDTERTTTLGGGVDLKLPFAAALKASAEIEARNRYSISGDDKRTYSEEVTLEIPPQRRVVVTFAWKQLWQLGTIVVCDATGNEVRFPYRVRLQPTFDQKQVEEQRLDQ